MQLVDPSGGIGFIIIALILIALWWGTVTQKNIDRKEALRNKYAKYGKEMHKQKLRARRERTEEIVGTFIDVFSSLASGYEDPDDPNNW